MEGAIIHGKRDSIIHNCSFNHNNGWNGGVFYIELVMQCQSLHLIANSRFSNNNTTSNGGATMTVIAEKIYVCF